MCLSLKGPKVSVYDHSSESMGMPVDALGECLLGVREVPGCCAYVCEDWKLKLTGSDSQCRKDVAFKKGQGKAVSESPPRHISSIASLQVSVG